MSYNREGSLGDGKPNRKYLSTLLHGLSILDMFTKDRLTVSIGEIAEDLGSHRSNASRMAATLAHAGYLRRTDRAGFYQLGGRMAALGELVRLSREVAETVTPHLERLTEETGETGHLAQLNGGDARTVAVTEGWHTIRMYSWVGKELPAYLSSMGKVVLAGATDSEVREVYRGRRFRQETDRTVRNLTDLIVDLQRIRQRGYGFDNEELEVGLRCVSAPIVDSTESVVAGMSISGPSQRMSLANIDEISQHVRWHAAQASLDLGSRSGVPKDWPEGIQRKPPALGYL